MVGVWLKNWQVHVDPFEGKDLICTMDVTYTNYSLLILKLGIVVEITETF